VEPQTVGRTFAPGVGEIGPIPIPRAGNRLRAVDELAPEPAAARRPLRRWMRRYVMAAIAVDLLAAVAALVTAVFIRLDPVVSTAAAPLAALSPLVGIAPLTAVVPLAWVVLVHASRGYEPGELGAGSEEFRSLLRAGLLLVAGISFTSYAFDLDVSRSLVVIAVPLMVALGAVGRYGLRRRVHALRAQGRCLRSVVVVGRERAVLDLVQQLRRERHCGMEVVGACVPDPAGAHLLRNEGIETVGDLDHVALVARALDADAVAVTSSSETAAAYLRRLSWQLEGAGVELLVAPGLTEIAGPRMHMRPFIGLPLVHVEEPEFRGPKRWVKGGLDRLVAGLAIVLLAPLLAAIALAVRLDSRGPILFRQVRIGRGGREFVMLKFRSMVADAEARREELLARNQNADGLLFKVSDDPRVTRVGRLLRRFSLDELPQLFNVFSGRMSLVGPRPPLPAEVALYDSSVSRRLLVKPGLTGLWQVSGRSDLSWDESVRLDLRYVENWSLLLDVMILWKTAFAVLRADGAY
jgi:exopolysaccharide biosynthesis polyprenyl glycosylphosphotransferase